MALTIRLREKTSIPVEVDSIRMDEVRSQSVDEVKATLVQYGNKHIPLSDFFDVEGSAADDSEIVWEGDCSHVKLIGANLASGKIRVEGNSGMHLGAEMTGGEIVVNGNSGDWVGAEMHGGRIHVRGNAGHLVGSVYRGGHRGMTGGEIIIDGDAGNEIGHAMRRGLIAVGGRSGCLIRGSVAADRGQLICARSGTLSVSARLRLQHVPVARWKRDSSNRQFLCPLRTSTVFSPPDDAGAGCRNRFRPFPDTGFVVSAGSEGSSSDHWAA